MRNTFIEIHFEKLHFEKYILRSTFLEVGQKIGGKEILIEAFCCVAIASTRICEFVIQFHFD